MTSLIQPGRMLSAVALVAALSACSPDSKPTTTSAGASTSVAAAASSSPGAGPRVTNQDLHASFTIPEGYAVDPSKGKLGPSDTNVSRTVFGLQNGPENAEIVVTNFTKESGGPAGMFAHKTDEQDVEYFLNLFPQNAEVTVDKTQKLSWSEDGTSGSGLVAELTNKADQKKAVAFYAFETKGEQRWMITSKDVQPSEEKFAQFPGGAAEALARSLQGL